MTITESHTATSAASWRARTAFGWFLLTSLLIALVAPLPYLTSSLADVAREQGDLPIAQNYVARPFAIQVALYVHASFGGLALLLSPLQFIRRIRSRVPRVHRMIGRIPLVSIAVAGLAGLTLAPFNLAGTVGVFGFGMLAGCWLGFAALAFRAIRRGDIVQHRRWAIRTFALTYAAVTLRLWVAVLVSAQVGLFDIAEPVAFSGAYLIVPFLAWVPNVIVAETYLRITQRGV
jgi:uncharacterized membrane protein